MTGVTALVLAGSRPGAVDPMAQAAGLAHKVLLPVSGVPMLLRVLRTLRACEQIGRIVVCAQDAGAMLATIGDSEAAIARGAASGPSESVAAMLAEFGTPLLVTTADHALLTQAMVAHFLAHAPHGADVVAAVARQETVQAEFPETRRTWLRFRDGAFSGCNLFLLCGERALPGVRFWQRLERERKRPWAMARLLGPVAMAAYGLRLSTIGGMLAHLGRLSGARLAIVDMPFAQAAIDVDKPEDLRLAERILST